MIRRVVRLALVALVLTLSFGDAARAEVTLAEGQASLKKLYKSQPGSKTVAKKAYAVLVFPNIVKAGFMVGGAIGNGVLIRNGKDVGHYNSAAASYGWQAGAQSFGYALFFMNKKALKSLDETKGLELGIGPSFVIVDQGMGKSMTSQTLTQDIYAFIFDQGGLMAGAGIQGSKITKLK